MAYVHQIRQIDFENSFQEPGYRHDGQSKIPVGAVVAVFFNFCSFHCVDCWNPETWHRQENLYVDNEVVANEIITAVKTREMVPPLGLSLLGGDPILPENVIATKEILEIVLTELPNLVVGVWTGYNWAAIERHRQKDSAEGLALNWVLNHIDVIIDGQFNRLKKIDNRRYGSINQRVINVPQSLKDGKVVVTKSYEQEHAEDMELLKKQKYRPIQEPEIKVKLPQHLQDLPQ